MSNPLNFWKPTSRNTPVYKMTVFGVTFTVSYETVVAVHGRLNSQGKMARLENVWGPTTGRHMNDAGVRDYPVLCEEEFDQLCTELLIEGCKNTLLAKLGE